MSLPAEKIYEGIANIKDEHTRNQLYGEFVKHYFPEAYEAIKQIGETNEQSSSSK